MLGKRERKRIENKIMALTIKYRGITSDYSNVLPEDIPQDVVVEKHELLETMKQLRKYLDTNGECCGEN